MKWLERCILILIWFGILSLVVSGTRDASYQWEINQMRAKDAYRQEFNAAFFEGQDR